MYLKESLWVGGHLSSPTHTPPLHPVPHPIRYGMVSANPEGTVSSGLVWWHQMLDWATQAALHIWTESSSFWRHRTLQLSDWGWGEKRSPSYLWSQKEVWGFRTSGSPQFENPTIEVVGWFSPASIETGCGGLGVSWGIHIGTRQRPNTCPQLDHCLTVPQAVLTVPNYLSPPHLFSVSFPPRPSSLLLSSQGKQHLIWKYMYYLGFSIYPSQSINLTAILRL